jgi:hypothetical protein
MMISQNDIGTVLAVFFFVVFVCVWCYLFFFSKNRSIDVSLEDFLKIYPVGEEFDDVGCPVNTVHPDYYKRD